MIPCGDKLLIKPDPVPETKPGGKIIIPQTTFAELVSGTVEHVHNGFHATDGTFVKSAFEPGDKVYYQQGQAVQAEVIPGLVLVQEAAIVMREEREGKKNSAIPPIDSTETVPAKNGFENMTYNSKDLSPAPTTWKKDK